MSSIKKLAGQTALYGLSSILARAINFLLVPFYTGDIEGTTVSRLTPNDFGVLTEYMTYVAFLIVFLTFGMETTYFRFGTEKEKEKPVFSQLLTYVFVLTLVVCSAIFFGSEGLKELLKTTGNTSYIKILALILFLDVMSSLPFARLRNQNKALKFATIKFLSIVINIGLNLLLIWYLPEKKAVYNLGLDVVNLDLTDKVMSIFISNLVANSIFVAFFFKDFILLFNHYNKEYFKPVLKYSYPIMILGLAGLINEMIDRIMLKEILPQGFYDALGWDSIEAIGIYAANYKFAIFITLAIQAYRYAAEPFFFKTGKEKNSKETFAQLMNIFVALLLFAAVLISVFRIEVSHLILRSEEFRKGIYIVPILLLANVCVGIYYNLSAWYKLTDKTIYGTIIGIGGAVITVALNFVLIPMYGFLGCAIATLVCYATMMIWSYVLGQKYYPIPYQVGKITLYFALSIATILISVYGLEQLPYATIYKVLLALTFSSLIYILEFRKIIKA